MKLMQKIIALMTLSLAATAWGVEPTAVSPAGHKAMAPELAVAADGAISIVWIERTPEGEAMAAAGAASAAGHTHMAEADVFFARSTDGGKTFTAPLRLNAEVGSVWGFAISKPRVLVARDGVIHVFYPGNSMARASGKPIVLPMYARSTDNGRTFAAPVSLGSVPESDHSDVVGGGLANAECFGTMAVDDRGGVYAYWIDTRDMSNESRNGKVFSAVSYDGGKSFGKDFEVFPADACPCCQLTATVADGKIYMGSRQVTPEGMRDSVVAISTDRGKTFQPRVRWGGVSWKIEGCPLKPTSIAVDGDHVYLVAYNGGANPPGAYFSRSTDGGKSYEPAVALHPGATLSDMPVVRLLDGRVIVAWQARTTGDRRIYMSVSRDRGKTFSAPVELAAPAGTGIQPVLAARAGGLQIAWQQGDTVMTQYLAGSNPLLGAPVAASQ